MHEAEEPDFAAIEEILDEALSHAADGSLEGVGLCAEKLPDIPYTVPAGPDGERDPEHDKNIHGVYKHLWWSGRLALHKAQGEEQKQWALLSFATRQGEQSAELFPLLEHQPEVYRRAMLESFHLVRDAEGLPVDGVRCMLEAELERMRHHLEHFEAFQHLDLPYGKDRRELEEHISNMEGALEYYISRLREVMADQ